jgi:hypothetical protein
MLPRLRMIGHWLNALLALSALVAFLRVAFAGDLAMAWLYAIICTLSLELFSRGPFKD